MNRPSRRTKWRLLLLFLGAAGVVVWRSRVWQPLVYEERFERVNDGILVMTTNGVVGLSAPSLRGLYGPGN